MEKDGGAPEAVMSSQPLNRALVQHLKPQSASSTPRKRPTFRPKEGWLTYNLHRQVDQAIILTSLVTLVDGLSDANVWQHHRRGRRGTNPRLILKILAVRFLFRVSAARTLGLVDLLRQPLNIAPEIRLPSDSTLDYRLRSGVLQGLLERLLELSLVDALDTTVALDSTGFATRREERKQWSTHGKKHPKGWLKAHLSSGTQSHRVYALEVTPGEAGDAPQAIPLLRATRRRAKRVRGVVGDNAYASKAIVAEADNLRMKPTMRLRSDTASKNLPWSPWGRMVRRARKDPDAYARVYHARSNAESTNHAWKHRLGDTLWTRHPLAQASEIKLKAVLHNLGCPPF